jgi:hypothetical protein
MDWEGVTCMEFTTNFDQRIFLESLYMKSKRTALIYAAICQARSLAYEGAQNLKARENNHTITGYKLYQMPRSAKIVSENFSYARASRQFGSKCNPRHYPHHESDETSAWDS